MFRRTRKFFTKLFRRHSDSSNADISPAGPLPTLASSPPSPSGLPAPLQRTPSPSIPPQPPALSTSRVPTPAISPPTSPSPQPHSVEHGLSSVLTASSPSHGTPLQPLPNLPLGPPTPDSIVRTPGSFVGARDFIIQNSQFVMNNFEFISGSRAGSGLKELLIHAMPDAFHNSAARYPPPRCHFGTRNDYIAKITDWALGNSDRHEPILWMWGPFGIGKSAVAQSCAEALQLRDKLAATLFLSRSNADRDDPLRVFTSIAYQIATICPPFRDVVDASIRDDPALAMKSLSTQFEELLVRPLRQIDIVRNEIEGRVVIIDGLDECRGVPGQCDIIDTIATSAQNGTTPFRWFITSRPEDPIMRTMNSDSVSPVSFHLELPVSRKIDHEILIYLTDEFVNIRKRYGLPGSWPSEADLALLVDRTAGLWIYITTIVRFITDENSFGPEDQLHIVLKFLKDVPAKVGPHNPLAEMDFLYTLIMQHVPLTIRTTVRQILLIHSLLELDPDEIATVLGLSEEQFLRSCVSIRSVMELQGPNLKKMTLHFYHTSFLDFLKDRERSQELYIYGDLVIQFRRTLLDRLCEVCSCSTGSSRITLPSKPDLFTSWDRNKWYYLNLYCFWCLCSLPEYPFDSSTAASLEKLPFRTMLQLLNPDPGHAIVIKHFRENLPAKLCDVIVREDKCPTPGCTNSKKIWILGRGENETIVACNDRSEFVLRNNQDPLPGWCPCGSRIKIDHISQHGGLGLERPETLA